MRKLIVIVGPTAVGKTKLSVELAKRINGEIINGDAMQIYRGMDIGTAKITESEKEGIVHHLFDELNPDETYSVAEYQIAVRKKIEEITSRGKMPILVGGTGLYVKSVLFDYEFSDIATQNTELYNELSNEEVYTKLTEIDPETAKELHPNNRRRVVRALQIFKETKEKKSAQIEKQEKKLLYDVLLIGLTDDRERLYERINNRVDKMIENGLINEVKQLRSSGIKREAQSMQAIGYKEIYDYLIKKDEIEDKQELKAELERAIELVKRNSRRLAKRQFTWFNNQMDVLWFEVDVNNFGRTIHEVLQEVEKT